MATTSKVYNWYYSTTGGNSVVNERPQIDNGPHIIPFSSLTEANSSQTVGGSINSVTVSLWMRRNGSSTVSVQTMFTLSNSSTTYSSDGWVTCSGITDTGTNRHTLTMSAANCPPASFFNAENFTLTVKHQNASRSGIYCVKGQSFILTVNYTEGSQAYVNVNGVWKAATPYVKVNGAWKKATPYGKVSGSWE